MMDPRVETFAATFARATGSDPPTEAFAFGDSPKMADELSALVASGHKRATAALHADHTHHGDPLPEPGDTAFVLDGAGEPVCVIRTTEVTVAPFGTVDDAFAWDEGEGDRSLNYWIAAHERFFRGRCEALGITFTPDLDVIFERFELVWPSA